VARQLGRLHRTLDVAELEGRAWLGRDPQGGPVPEERRKMWRSTPCAQIALSLLADLDCLALAAVAPAPCLVHGDCHAQNLLLDEDGELVWADWQAVGHGHGPEDLALLWQRAQFNGATPPRAATLTAYAEGRDIRLDETFQRAVTAAELCLLLVGWPGFLLQEPSPGRDSLFDLLHGLDAAWRRRGRA
jgi:aminoglycoside phosphotransferase (APT) family kinase protein